MAHATHLQLGMWIGSQRGGWAGVLAVTPESGHARLLTVPSFDGLPAPRRFAIAVAFVSDKKNTDDYWGSEN